MLNWSGSVNIIYKWTDQSFCTAKADYQVFNPVLQAFPVSATISCLLQSEDIKS